MDPQKVKILRTDLKYGEQSKSLSEATVSTWKVH